MTGTTAGKANTSQTLDAAFAFATQRNIQTVVVASTFGPTGLAAAQLAKKSGHRVIVVTHNVGFKTPGEVELTNEIKQEIEALGATVMTGTMVLRGLGASFRKRFGGSDEDRVSSVLRMFGQGMKVVTEMAAMVSDAGLVGEEDIVCVAGTGRGADTAVLLKPASANCFLDMQIKHIIVKPELF